MQLKDYLNVIRRTVIFNSFLQQYFLKIVVIYLLENGVTPWIAVSIPIVSSFSHMLFRASKKIINLSLKLNYKKYHLFYLIFSTILCLIISQCSSLFTIYFFTIIYGILTAISHSTITKLNTSNHKYESYCFVEEERAFTIGATLGFIISQILYDINPKLYLFGFIIICIIDLLINIKMPNISENIDEMQTIEETEELTKEEIKETLIITILFGFIAGLWCMGISALEELTPLLSKKVGYLNSIYTVIELLFLFLISGKILDKIKKKKKLLLFETIIAICDVLYLLFASIFKTEISLFIIYFFMGISSTLGDPIWGSIISKYSCNNRKRYALVNKIYFYMRAMSTFITWIICRECIIRGTNSFIYLSIILLILITILYFIANKLNKKIFKETI